MLQDLRYLVRDCDRCAKFLEDNPGLQDAPGIVPDLYRTVARLAKLLSSNAQRTKAPLGESHE